ncbi:MAG: transcriptional regulator [Ignavibacteria bacterium RBG_16_34_14]|nr:MAG: transcriptional regulator [Ignavibacteria bacterium RBG_16_34_14]
MSVSIRQFEQWLQSKEKEHLEFKEAKQQYDLERLKKYCNAIANECGGHLILGVDDNFPHNVVGTNAFQNPLSLKKDLLDLLKLRIDIEEFFYIGKRILIFEIPSRPIGLPLQYKGASYMRVGESLEPMTPEQLKRIFDEAQPDFSAEICNAATISDLDEIAVAELRHLWSSKSRNPQILTLPVEQLFSDAELLVDGKLNYAALILLGKKESLGKLLPNAEIVFEYRSIESSIQAQQRYDYRIGFLSIHNKLWDQINLRNDVEHIQEGLFIRDIPNFNEEVIREGLLNAVCHRDYNLQSSVFIRQYPALLEIESPGGFPAGITLDNIIYKQYPRNRRIAEVFQKCGLVERSGQGVDKMFRLSIEEAKPRPDYSKSDAFSVILKIIGEIQDIKFLKFLEKVSSEKKIEWTTQDLLIFDDIRQGKTPPAEFQNSIIRMSDQGIIEKFGRGRGVKFILSKRFYTFLGEKGIYTRKKGLDTETKKVLIIKHLENHGKGTMEELEQIFPSLSRHQIFNLLRLLKKENKIQFKGSPKKGAWILL